MFDHFFHRIFTALTAHFIHNVEDLIEMLVYSLFLAPADQFLSHLVDQNHLAFFIRCYHSIADRAEGNGKAFSLIGKGAFHPLALSDVLHSSHQRHSAMIIYVSNDHVDSGPRHSIHLQGPEFILSRHIFPGHHL